MNRLCARCARARRPGGGADHRPGLATCGWQPAPAAAVIEISDDGPGVFEANRGRIAGRVTSSPETLGAGYAVLLADALTLGYVMVLKFFTGRPAPRGDYIPSLAEDDAVLSRKFRPGFYRGGVVLGWPSGHVAVTCAMLSALVFYYPDSWLLKAALLVGSGGMMLGVSSFEKGGMHWCSDAVAGALMAFPIGMSTGRGMRSVVQGEKGWVQSAWFVTPSLRPEVSGAMVGRSF